MGFKHLLIGLTTTTTNATEALLQPEMKRTLAPLSKSVTNISKEIRHPKEGHSDPHRTDPHFPLSAPVRAAHALPYDWVPHGIRGGI